MQLRKISAFAGAALLLFTGVVGAYAAAMPDKNNPTQSLSVSDNVLVSTMPPAIFGSTNPSDEHTFKLCDTFDDATCSAATLINFFNHLPPCTADNTVDCIKSVWATDSAGNKIEGSFVKYVAGDNPSHYAAIPSLGIPLGKGLGSIWSIPGVKNAAGNSNYLLDIALNGFIEGTGALVTRRVAFGGGMTATLTPVDEKPDPQNDSQSIAVSANANNGLGTSAFGNALGGICAGHEPKLCYAKSDFPAGYRFGFAMSLTHGFTGWFHGRFFAPNITITNGAQQVINVEADPVIVPTLEVTAPTSSLPQAVSDYIFSGRVFGMGAGKIIGSPSNADTFDLANLFLPIAKDTATTSNSFWSFKTLDGNQSIGDVQRCTASDGGVSGVVTTNALVYSAGPPAFNQSTNSLDYKLLSPHYQSDGKPAVGTYDLLLRSTVARCIYKFSSAPVKASIEIISNDGNAQIATTVLTESNGWLKMSAKGFGYSNPTIKVKLTQDAPPPAPTPTPVATPEPTPSASPTPVVTATPTPQPVISTPKKTTITCIKGKTTKIVTAVKPTCPTGYKRK
jgi:hypothetical protein